MQLAYFTVRKRRRRRGRSKTCERARVAIGSVRVRVRRGVKSEINKARIRCPNQISTQPVDRCSLQCKLDQPSANCKRKFSTGLFNKIQILNIEALAGSCYLTNFTQLNMWQNAYTHTVRLTPDLDLTSSILSQIPFTGWQSDGECLRRSADAD